MQTPHQNPLSNPEFWVAVIIALLVKIKTSRQLGPWQVITTIVVAVGAAWIASDYVAEQAGLPFAIAAALVTLTAEGAMRLVLIGLYDPKQAIALWKEWKK